MYMHNCADQRGHVPINLVIYGSHGMTLHDHSLHLATRSHQCIIMHNVLYAHSYELHA